MTPFSKMLQDLSRWIRDAATYFADLPDVAVPKDMLALAEHILESKRADFDPDSFKDRYEEAVVAMLKAKQAGAPQPAEKRSFGDNKIVDLMEALKRSLASTPSPKTTLKPGKARKRIEGQREMLLPISGKKDANARSEAGTTPAKIASKTAKASAKAAFAKDAAAKPARVAKANARKAG